MSTLINRRPMAVLGTSGAIAFASLGHAAQASASTLYACVKKNGTARLFASKPRCRKGETRLFWNVEGPQGPRGHNGANGRNGREGNNGANGTNGTNGANGAAGGFSTSNELAKSITAAREITVLSKTLPAGSYIVLAKASVGGLASKAERWAVVCELVDEALLDTSVFTGQLFGNGSATEFTGGATLALEAAATLKAPTTVSLRCSDFSPDLEETIQVSDAQLVAIQTAQNS